MVIHRDSSLLLFYLVFYIGTLQEWTLDLTQLFEREMVMRSVQGTGAVRWFWLLLIILTTPACYFLGLGEGDEGVSSADVLPTLEIAGAKKYQIDPARSVIQLRVYRDGLLARLGHNHVIVATAIEGVAYRREPLSQSSFDLRFPVAGLVVDRPSDRRRAGADFSGEIPQPHIDGTRTNMLGPQLLDAQRYPTIELRSMAMTGRQPQPIWQVAVKLRGQVVKLNVPVQLFVSGQQLTAQGALTLSQRELGLAQFCVLGGKLCVRDTIDAEFYFVAVATP